MNFYLDLRAKIKVFDVRQLLYLNIDQQRVSKRFVSFQGWVNRIIFRSCRRKSTTITNNFCANEIDSVLLPLTMVLTRLTKRFAEIDAIGKPNHQTCR